MWKVQERIAGAAEWADDLWFNTEQEAKDYIQEKQDIGIEREWRVVFDAAS